MGVISLYFVDYVVEVFVIMFIPLHFLIASSYIGCALSAPDGSSPRGYVWVLVDRHRLKIHLFFLLLTFQSPRVQVEVFIPCDHNLLFSLFFPFFDIIVCCMQNLTPVVRYVYGPYFSTGAR
jgi:hypothetical protein